MTYFKEIHIQFAYSQYMNSGTPHIFSVRTDCSFHGFNQYAQRNYIQRFTSFYIFLVNVRIHSAYSKYTNIFTPHILIIREDSFTYLENASKQI